MGLQSTRFLKGFIAFIITIAVLYAGQMLWEKYEVTLPLDNALKSISEIEKANWSNDKKIGSTMEITIILANTNNFQKTYKEIDSNIKKALKGKPYKLNIKDNRTTELEDLYYEIELYVQKSIVDGNFPILMDKVKDIAKAHEAIGKVYVDKDNVYIQMHKDNSSLYELAARNSDKVGGY